MRGEVLVLLLAFCFSIYSTSIHAQNENAKDETGLTFSASYIGDVVSNFSGGIKRGTTYLGLANFKVGFNTEVAKWWKGGEVFINVGNTHGGEPTKTFIGDFQGISNIEAGNLSFMYELWYRQTIGNASITIGLQDLNAEFAVTENGTLFTNSSFGIQSSISDNIPTPIFPLTALGAKVNWHLSDSYSLHLALFDGTPDDYENNPYNMNWKLSKDQGFLSVAEFQMNKSLIQSKKGSYKLGIYYHQHNDTVDTEQQNGGVYMIFDQQITNNLSVFSQIGFSPKSKDKHNYFYSLGFNYMGLFRKRPFDQAGIAVAHASIDKNSIGSETAIELTYKYNVCKSLYVRPDIQYIINPAGAGVKLQNALVGFIRFGIDF